MLGNLDWVRENYFADVKLEDGTWKVCRILQVQDDEVKFILDGYLNIYNLKFNQNRFAPFRKFTNLYTGPSTAQRLWIFKAEELNENLGRVKKIINENFSNLSISEIIQYLRGELPIFIENLIELDYGADLDSLSTAVTLFDNVIQLIINYYNWLKLNCAEFEELIKNPDLQQATKTHALCSCLSDILDLNEKLLNLQPRCRRLFSIINPAHPKFEISSNLQDKSEYSSTFLHLTDHFVSLGGFEALIQLIAEPCSPVSLLGKSLLHIFKDFINPEKYLKLNQKLMEAVVSRAKSLSDKEIKAIEVETVQRLLSVGLADPSDDDLCKELLIEFYIKLLKSSYLEKRIKGINEISAFCESVLNDQQQLLKTAQLLKQGSVLSEVLETRPHLEILKRSVSLFKVAGSSQMIGHPECKLLLNLARDERKSESETGYKIIEETFEFLSEDLQSFLFEHLENLNLEKINFSVLTQLSLKTFSKTKNIRIEPFLIQLLKNSSAGSRIPEVVESLKRIYTCEEGKTSAERFLESFSDLLQNSSSAVQVIQITHHILSSLDKEALKVFIKTRDLKQVLLKNLFEYLGSQEEESENQRRERISFRLKILGFIMFHTDYEVHLKTSELAQLWDQLVKNPKTQKDTQIFLTYLGSNIIRESLINDSEKVFKTFFLDQEMLGTSLNMQEINTFRVFFIRTNEKNCFVVKDQHLKAVKAGGILGIEKLFSVYLNSDIEKISMIEKIMFTLFTNYHISLQSEIQQLFNHHLQLFIEQVDLQKEKNVELALKFFNILLEVTKTEENLQKFFLLNGDKYEEIVLPQFATVRAIRKAIAQVLGKSLSRVCFRNGETVYSDLHDFQKIRLKPENYLQFVEDENDLISFCPSEFLAMSDFFHDFIFEKLLNSKKYQQKTWIFIKNLPVRPEYAEKLTLLDSMNSLLISPHEYFHVFTLFKTLANDSNWMEKFRTSKTRENFLNFVLKNRKNTEFLLVQDELYIEILSELEIFSDLLKPVLEDLLEIHQKALLPSASENFESCAGMSYLENIQKFFNNLLKIYEFYYQNHSQLFIETCEKAVESLLDIIISFLPTLKVKSRLFKSIENTFKLLIFSTGHQSTAFQMMFNALDTSRVSLDPSQKFYWKFLLSITKTRQISAEDLKKARGFIFKLIRPLKEETSCNQTLRFSLKLLKSINLQVGSTEVSPDEFETTFKHLLLGETDNSSSSLCKNHLTRASGYRYLLTLAPLSSSSSVLATINSFFSTLHWRSSKNWSIHFSQREKTGKYSGLRNLGNTCYMNSLLQQLFFIESFSTQLLSLDIKDSELVSFQVKKLFMKLKYLNCPFSSTKSFCQNFKDFENRPINPLEQMDVDEFYCKLMDKLENDLRSTQLAALVQEHFGMVSAIEMISECGDRGERHEPMLNVPIEVKNKKDLLDSLNTLVKGEVMSGENAYFCERCSAKVTSLRRTSFKVLPNFLVFSLRRFEFNYDYMVRNKLNDYFEFPFELNMKEFTTEYLNSQQLADDQYYLYTLKGVVVHVGRAEQGHYYSFVKVDQDWLEFNDTLVNQVRPETVRAKGFGRNADAVFPNAYLLVYERKTKYELNRKSTLKIWESQQPIIDENYVNGKNMKLWVKKIVLSHDFLKFQLSFCRVGGSLLIYLNYFLTVLVRIDHHYKEKLFLLRSILKNLDREAAEYLLEILCSVSGILEFFLTCPNALARKMVVLLMRKSLEHVAKETIEAHLEHLVIALSGLNSYSIQTEYLEAIYCFSLKVPEKVLEIQLLQIIFNLLLGNQIQAIGNHLKTTKLGYDNNYKFTMNGINDQNSTSRMYCFETLRKFLPLLAETDKNNLKSHENRDTLLKFLNYKDLRFFSYLFRDLHADDIEESSNFVLNYLQSMVETAPQNRDYFKILLFQYLEHHPNRIPVTLNILDFFLSIIPVTNSEEFEYFVNFLLKVLSGVEFSLFCSILTTERIASLIQTAESMRFIVMQQNHYQNPKIEKLIQNLKSLPMIEVLKDLESGFPESDLQINNPILIFDNGRKAWFEGKILEILENSLVLVEYATQSGQCFALKSLQSEELFPKN